MFQNLIKLLVLITWIQYQHSLNLKTQNRLRMKIRATEITTPSNEVIEDYESIKKSSGITVAIAGTSDLHGYGTPDSKKTKTTPTQYYEAGGINYIAGYLNILKEEYGQNFIYVDAGDTFFGKFETKLTNGGPIYELYNKEQLAAMAIGNHQVDFKMDFLKDFKAKLKTAAMLTSNVMKKNTEEQFIPFSSPYKIVTVEGGIKIGFIGVTTDELRASGGADFRNGADFKDYVTQIKKYANELRTKGGVNAVVLLGHLGMACKTYPEDQYKPGIYTTENANHTCEFDGADDDLRLIIDNIGSGVIDAVVAGHVHQEYHYYYKGIPIIIPKNHGAVLNVIYLHFDENGKLDDSAIEGALPVCSKIFPSTKTCDASVGETMIEFNYHGKPLVPDAELTTYLKTTIKTEVDNYSKEVVLQNKYSFKCGKEERENPFDEIVLDGLRNITNAQFAVMGNGNFRSSWKAGDVTNMEIIEMFPFGNDIVSFEMTGEEVVKMVKTILLGRNYQFSGLIIEYKNNTGDNSGITVVDLIDENTGEHLIADKVYTVASIYFNIPNYGDDFDKVEAFYPKVKNLKYFGNDVINLGEYLRQLKVIDTEEYSSQVQRFIENPDGKEYFLTSNKKSSGEYVKIGFYCLIMFALMF